jgi:tetratricopeptide (TPR) repeat protein
MTYGQSPYRVVVTADVSAPADSALEASRLYNEGLAHLQAGNLANAELSFRQALAINGDLAGAHAHLGVALQGLQRPGEAVRHYERALALAPSEVGTLNNLGNVLLELGRPDDAIAQYRRALALAPERPEVHVNLANALHAASRHDEAADRYRQALALDPAFARAHVNWGNSLKDLGRYDEAIACYERALAIDPGYVAARMNLGQTLHMADRREEAIDCYRQGLVSDPGNADARMNLGILQLSLGRLSEGWENYAHRWAVEGHAPARAYPHPGWDGQHVRGTLLVWGEQGIGDQILHTSMIPEIAGRADEVVLEVEPRLMALFARSFPAVRVIGLARALYAGQVEAYVPLGGLGTFLRPDLDAFPRRDHGYLAPDDARVRALRNRLTADSRTVVGLSWTSRNPEFGSLRSARLGDFEALLRLPGCRFVDLQYGDTQAERAAVEHETGVRVDRLDDIDNTNDIDGLAALIGACDLVVTVDNTTVHLAGALGRPTWVLVPHGHARIWYWFEGRDDSPWYPRVRVMRQRKGQAWAELISAVAKDLARSNERR